MAPRRGRVGGSRLATLEGALHAPRMSDLEVVHDSVEGAFTVALPRGWQNRAWLERRGTVVHNLATSTSPDGTAALFIGDPQLPRFTEPAGFMGAWTPDLVPRPFTSIEHFLPGYALERFGGLPGFRLLHMAPSPELHSIVLEKALRSGAQGPWVTAGRLGFELADGAAPIRGLLFGSTIRVGLIWWAEVMGLTTTGEVDRHAPALLTAFASRLATPATHQRQMQERAAAAASHQRAMATLDANAAILRSNHQHNMATLGAMAEAHQQRMEHLHQAHAEANAAWSERQRAGDAAQSAERGASDDAHRRFLNMIAEERTVADPEGHTYQVAAGYERYFRRRSDGTWIGTRGDRDLRGLPGVNPDDFDEMKIKV